MTTDYDLMLCEFGMHEWAVDFVAVLTWLKCRHCPAERCIEN